MQQERKPFLIAAIALAMGVWPIAFNLGAYKAVLYGHLFAIMAASLALLIGRFLVDSAERRNPWGSVFEGVVLVLPSAWLMVEIISHGNENSLLAMLRTPLSLATAIFSLPYIIYFIVTTAIPGVEQLKSWQLKVKLVIVVSLVAVIAYLGGEFHQYVLSCTDFELAGSAIPTDCWQP